MLLIYNRITHAKACNTEVLEVEDLEFRTAGLIADLIAFALFPPQTLFQSFEWTVWASAASKACLCGSAQGMFSLSYSIPTPSLDVSWLQRITKSLTSSSPTALFSSHADES